MEENKEICEIYLRKRKLLLKSLCSFYFTAQVTA